VRVSVPTWTRPRPSAEIKQQVALPLVTDIHFDYRSRCAWPSWAPTACASTRAISAARTACAPWSRPRATSGIPIRIGVNAGSLEKDLQKKYGEPTPEALVESALRHIEILDKL
jgi:(E)-4-hydroxy-3-methylbut-2-enyl-diphosphate synthase